MADSLYHPLSPDSEKPRNSLALYFAVFCSSLAFTLSQTTRYDLAVESTLSIHAYPLGELICGLVLGLIPFGIRLKVAIGSMFGIAGGVFLVLMGLWVSDIVWVYLLARLFLGAWTAGAMLAVINYMTNQVHFFNVGIVQALGHLVGVLVEAYLLPE
jgi:hypothetical protein